MDLVYLDYNCFQRGFDDPSQIRIQMEALACHEIFIKAERGEVQLVWSFMHQDETLLCPFPERKHEAFRLAALCKIKIGPKNEVFDYAKSFQEKEGLSSKDALHLACAHYVKADFFLTCDDRLEKQAKRLNLKIRIMNPINYIRLEVRWWER